MIKEKTSRIQVCTDCNTEGHFTVMNNHECDTPTVEVKQETKKKTTKKK